MLYYNAKVIFHFELHISVVKSALEQHGTSSWIDIIQKISLNKLREPMNLS